MRFGVLCLLLFQVTACASVWTEQRRDWHPSQPVPGLLVHLSVSGLTPPKEELQKSGIKKLDKVATVVSGVIDTADFLFQNIPTEDENNFLNAAYEQLATTLAEYGIAMTVNPARAARLEDAGWVGRNEEERTYYFPGTSEVSFHDLWDLFHTGVLRRLVKAIGCSSADETFVSAKVVVSRPEGLFSSQRPEVTLQVRVIDGDGRDVLRIKTAARGDNVYFNSKLTPQDFQALLVQAVQKRPNAISFALKD